MSNTDFRAVKTPLGTQYLHKSGIVWYSRSGAYWFAYQTTNDYKGEKPWCHFNWQINDEHRTEQEAIASCLQYLDK